ncbi:MAG: bifunctional diaminohydroxyphosphoribosylaminopyrimidine deaminase/5-amino-6-(5-phosphoribosylamino)uracil reductase RibD [Gemmatimonadetes bacterium]|nr:bifunctional diaminohydroxyphosphoribosylaminopyrimidine deaminase/5-amino-6-(5-phosphoribosylamino)uracil reductase RibD [Gemmatimonadota bacterium]
MGRALALAARAGGRTSPNPMVGAVAIDPRTGRVLAEGFHLEPGLPHAEQALIAAAAARNVDLRGATLVCSLEPCVHHGRTAPCAPLVAAAGFSRAVLAVSDPDPRVDGRGIRFLREAGLDVTVGMAEGAARRLNEGFFQRATGGRPFVHLKMAMLPDGTVHPGAGRPAGITGEAARGRVHAWRHLSAAVMVGAGTLRADDPRLTVRVPATRPVTAALGASEEAASAIPSDHEPWQPRRVVLSASFRVPPDARALRPLPGGPPALVIGSVEAPVSAETGLRDAGVETARVLGEGDRLQLAAVLDALGSMGVSSVLVEGGPTLADALLGAGLVQRLSVFTAEDPGREAPQGPRASPHPPASTWRPPGGLPFTGAWLRDLVRERLGNDELVTGRMP